MNTLFPVSPVYPGASAQPLHLTGWLDAQITPPLFWLWALASACPTYLSAPSRCCLVPSHSSSMDLCHPGPLSPLSPPPSCLWPWAMARTVSLPAAPGQSRAATWVSQFRPRLTIWSQKFQVKPLTKKADENAISHVVLLNIFLLCLTSLKIPALACKMLKGLYFLSKNLPGTKGTYCKVTKYKCTRKSWTHTHFCANVSWKALCTSENVV